MLVDGHLNRLKSRHKDNAVSKKCNKFELDRANWTTYTNFKLMHVNIGVEIVEANIATENDEPIWMDSTGNACE